MEDIELTEDTVIEGSDTSCNPELPFDDFIKRVLTYNPHADKKLIKDAFDFAKKAHAGQRRESGEEYIVHPYCVAQLMIRLKADSATIAASLLHDCVEDSKVSIPEIKKLFGEEVANLVEGLTKISGIEFGSKEEYNAENIRKVLIATTKDIRVILIKLADRLHNMRTLKYLREDKQLRIANETLNVFAPIAHKLGVRFIKGELEDLALKYLEPEAYIMLREVISEKRGERDKRATMFINHISNTLKGHNITAKVYGRAKYFFSIYKKMKKENKDFNEIYDLMAIRIIVKTIPECYAALGIVHELFKPVPKRFKDYISVPKANGYQSLHTSVVGGHGRIIEIQIRTAKMHYMAEEGLAAHWRYKGTERDKKFDRKMAWLKQMLEWKRESDSAKDFVETLKIDLFANEIVVFTPKGDNISLPEMASPVDFAYAVHSNVGDKCFQAEVNGNSVPLDHILKSGDIIHIITRKDIKPSRSWLAFVKSSKARSKIRSKLGIKSDYTAKGEEGGKTSAELLKMVEIKGKSAPLKFSKCCDPDYGEPIVAFKTKDNKISVHKKECPNIYALQKHRPVEVKWKGEEEKPFVKMKVTVTDRVGLLQEILEVIAKARINLLSLNTRTKKGKINMMFKLGIENESDFDYVVSRVKKLSNVLDVRIN